MEQNKTKNINFLKKVWYSITKFEKYPDMSAEGTGSAIKYLIILISIVTVFLAIGSLLELNKTVNKLAEYIETNIPEFSYSKGKLSMELGEPMVIEDVQYNGIDRVVLNPTAETEEQKNQSEKENDIIGTTIFFYKDQIILKSKIEEGQVSTQPYTYKDFVSSYTGENVETFNKQELVEYMTTEKMNSYYIRYAIAIFFYLIIMNILVELLNALELAILGWITSITARIRMRMIALYNMSIYALTLPIILNIVYIIINYFTEFKITYFSVAYITIAYIYLAATIFIIKDDFMKREEELTKIRQEQEKVKEEIRQHEEQKKEQKERKKKDKEKEKENKEEKNENGEEPEGSEA